MARSLLREQSNGTSPTALAPPSPVPSVVSLSPPKQRKPSWVLAGVMLVGLAALLSAWVFSAASRTMSVMVTSRDLTSGEVVGPADLRVVELGESAGFRAISPTQQNLILGKAARGPLPAGTVVNTDLFGEKGKVIPKGQVVVGVSLEAGAAPTAGLAAGDRVDVLGIAKVAATSTATAAVATLLTPGTVWSVDRSGATSTSPRLWVSVLVPVENQVVVAQAAADGRLRLTLVGAAG